MRPLPANLFPYREQLSVESGGTEGDPRWLRRPAVVYRRASHASCMPLTRTDAIVYIYTLGAVVSGGLLVAQVEISENVPLLVVSAVTAAGWLVYFRQRILPRVEAELVDDEDEATDERVPPTARE